MQTSISFHIPRCFLGFLFYAEQFYQAKRRHMTAYLRRGRTGISISQICSSTSDKEQRVGVSAYIARGEFKLLQLPAHAPSPNIGDGIWGLYENIKMLIFWDSRKPAFQSNIWPPCRNGGSSLTRLYGVISATAVTAQTQHRTSSAIS